MFVDSDEVEATLSESPPDSNAERKRALTDAYSRETSSPQRYGRKKSPKRAKPSEQGEEGGEGISPHTRTQASIAETARRSSQHGESSAVPYNHFEPVNSDAFMLVLTPFFLIPLLNQAGLGHTNLAAAAASLQSAVDNGAAAAARTSAMDRQRLLLQELMASQSQSNFSLLGAQQQSITSHNLWGAAPAMMSGGSNAGLFNQQPAPDLAQILQLRALNQLSMQGYQAPGMNGHGHGPLSMGMNMGMNPYGMPFPDTRQSMHPVGHGLPGLGPYGGFMRNSAPSLAAIRAGLGGATDMPFRDMYPAGVGLPGGIPSLNNQNMMYAMTQARGVMPTAAGVPRRLPCILAQPEDNLKLSEHQVQLRHQIEAFQATDDDISTHTRGRNKPIVLGQVGIRCRHCSHMPVCRRKKGSTYFPATLLGLYQAAQNMSTTHMQCGLCTEMPEAIKIQFTSLLTSKVASSGAGRPYWAQSAKKLGLVDTEEGIFCSWDLPAGVRVIRDDSS
jgi:hypothetical protein